MSQPIDYTMRYQIRSGRVNFADFVKRRELIQEGRLLGQHAYPPDNDASIITSLQEGEINTTPAELASYLAEVAPVPTSTVPSPPTSLSATGGDGEITISFTPGADGGSPITNYEYFPIDASGAAWTPFSPPVTTSPVVITGLPNGSTLQFKLRAVNANGPSAESAIVSGTTLSAPSAPTSLSATAGNGQVTISFTTGSDGGSTITNYKYSTNNGATYTAFSPADTSSPVTITGLTNGTTYQIKLRAVNAIGDGTESSAVSGTPSTVPSAPTGLSGSPGNTIATISFTAGSNGGSAITNYEYSTDGGSTFLAFSPADAASPVTISTLSSDGTTPLTNGVSYTIQLKAVNANGTSVASSSVTVTPAPGIDVIILGDAAVTTLSSSLQSARTALGYSVTLNITTQQLNGYTGTNLSSFDVCILYTNGGLSLNATLGGNLNSFVSGGGHLIMASFSWGNVSAISSFNYNSYSTYQYNGTYTSTDTSTAIYSVVHPITTGIATSTGGGSQNVPNPILSTTTPGTQVIATFGNGTTSFIAVGQNGSARLVGINLYVAGAYSGNFQNTLKYVCNSVYWCMGLI
jgi:hypothetical protein